MEQKKASPEGSYGKQILSFITAHKKLLAIGLALFVVAIIAIRFIWLVLSFPGADIGEVFEALNIEKTTSTIPMGETFGQDDLAITPIEVTYTSSSVYYNEYGEPYVSLDLDITCLYGTWEPEYLNITFWLDGSAAFNQPRYDQTEIKRGQTHRYTFFHPLITTSTQDVDMRLVFECKTGTTVELYFSVDGVQEFFGGGYYDDYYYSYDSYDDYYGDYSAAGYENILGKYEHESNGCVISIDEFTDDGGGNTISFFLSEQNHQNWEENFYLEADLRGVFYAAAGTPEYSFEVDGYVAYLYFYMTGEDIAEIQVLNNSWDTIGDNNIPVDLLEGTWYRTEEWQSLM